MATVFGILFLISAAFWTLVTLRALPGSTTHVAGGTLHNTWGHTFIGAGLAIVFLIIGLALL